MGVPTRGLFRTGRCIPSGTAIADACFVILGNISALSGNAGKLSSELLMNGNNFLIRAWRHPFQSFAWAVYALPLRLKAIPKSLHLQMGIFGELRCILPRLCGRIGPGCFCVSPF